MKSELKIFAKQPITDEMILFLVATTLLVIQVKPQATSSMGDATVLKHTVLLTTFIKRLIAYLNVQTPTLMATLIYLNKLRNLLPANAVGMETTRHRIFLAALILLAKSLNDSSPLNKHWTKYTDGLLLLQQVNMAERELIALLNWDITINEDELVAALQPFLLGIHHKLQRQQLAEQEKKALFYRLSTAHRKPLSNSSILTCALLLLASLLLLLYSLNLLPSLGLSLMLLLLLLVDDAAYVLTYPGRKLVAPAPTRPLRVLFPLKVLNTRA
ncbi:cyclin [Kocuria palustris]|nr:cyclin [Kocuria palustris]